MLIRESYLKDIRPFYSSDLIKAMVGVRRAGKSVLLSQIRDEIRTQGHLHMFYVNLEDYQYHRFWNDPEKFHELVRSKALEKQERCYIFLDEIQHVQDYWNVLASLKATTNSSIFVTGSSSSLLNSTLSTRLTGRVKTFRIFPFSFMEASSYTDGKMTLDDYLVNGGIPLRFSLPENEGNAVIEDTFNSILEKDILPKINQTYRNTFLNFARFAIAQSGSLVSTRSLAGYISFYDQKISRQTLYSYLEKLVDSYLLTKVDRFSLVGKKTLNYIQKYYATDPAFITISKGGQQNEGIGGNLESVVFNELLKRGYNVFVGKAPKGEVDFVVTDGQKRCYIQVAAYMETEETREREFGAYKALTDNYPKFVISMDRDDFSRDGIIHINAQDFLLRKKDLVFF
ncbi:MAG: ATP-binding protein [Sphaerochaetaceae bacterium]